jgi:predicted regulator of Ras-like GTPase activity (Roadblock/LC7/MglB family)
MTARLNELLRRLQAADGIDLVAVVSMEGQIIDVVAREDVNARDLGAVAANGMLMMRAMGYAMSRGEPVQAIIEYQAGLLLLEPLDRDLGLVMVASRETNLGRMRLVARKYGQDLLQAASVSIR